MFSSSRPTNTQQHAQRTQFPSIIRTRSQQGRPLSPVDVYASPFKSAVRSHSHSTNQTRTELKTENMDIPTHKGTHDGTLLSPSHKKRASSPSFDNSDNTGKRTRVLAQSNKANSPSYRHSEELLDTPHSDTPVTHVTPSRVVSDGFPGKGLTHVDLTRVPSSPSKLVGSPHKTFKIIKDDGYAVRVPTTPVRRPTVDEKIEMRTTSPQQPFGHPSVAKEYIVLQSPTRVCGPAALREQHSAPIQNPSTSSLPDRNASSIPANDTIPTVHIQSQSTPARPKYLTRSLLFGGGSPLTPLPSTTLPNGSTLPRKPRIPSNVSSEGFTPTNKPAISSTSSGVPQSSPSKSRIPVPSSSSISRLSKRPSSLSISTLPVPGSSSPVKASSRPSPIKYQTRTKGKVKSRVMARGPMTRLAAKRGLRRTSSSFTGLRTASVGSNAPLPPLDSKEPLNANVAVCVRPAIERKSLVTSSFLSSENISIQAGSTACALVSSSLGSPKKSSLTALSTALQKLTTAPPTAPLPRPRPNTSLGFVRPSLIPSQALPAPAFDNQDDVHVGMAQDTAGLERAKSSRQLDKMNAGLGKMGLPLRRPSMGDSNGRSVQWTGAPFASKQTTLSTVPASPFRSRAPTEADELPAAQGDQAEVVDVDAWVSSSLDGKGEKKSQTETNRLEYFVPLADEPLAKKQQPHIDLISPSRRASQASLLLSQSLSHSRLPAARPLARSASTSAVKLNPRTPVKTRGRTRPSPLAPQPASEGSTTVKPDDPMGGKRSNARMPGSLDVLKDCIIFVDVRTEEGEDAAALFVDMLRGLGARILAKPGKSCTHLVYKAGLPSTITRYKLLPEPRPLAVSIGWVVECVEKRAHVDEVRFLVNLDEIGVAGGVQRRRSMQPKQMRTLTLGQLDNGEPADISVRADSSFTSEEPSTSGLILANLSPPARSPNDHLPPLERARQRSLRLPHE